MKILRLIVVSFYNLLFTSADPNLFGSQKRQQAYQEQADKFYNKAEEAESENPFESAAAKSAMTKATKSAQQMSKKFLNTMGANQTAESKLSAMGQTQSALASAAGNIAAGAEQTAAQKAAQYNQMGASAEQKGIAEKGSGWDSFMDIMNTAGGLATGVGSVI